MLTWMTPTGHGGEWVCRSPGSRNEYLFIHRVAEILVAAAFLTIQMAQDAHERTGV
jgi:hypothetical protein